MPSGEYSKDLLQTVSNMRQAVHVMRRKRKWSLLLFLGLCVSAQLMTCAGYGESFFIEQLPDFQYVAYISSPVHALPRAALHGLQLGEFGFPKTEDIRRKMAEARHFSDAEVKLIGNHNLAALFQLPGGFPIL
jgi:hypothetical protein